MALYEYHCTDCGARTERRMPMSDVVAFIPCPKCGKQAKKLMASFALTGVAQEGLGDGPAPWDDDGGGDSGGGDHGGHSHGPGGHSHGHDHSFDGLDL